MTSKNANRICGARRGIRISGILIKMIAKTRVVTATENNIQIGSLPREIESKCDAVGAVVEMESVTDCGEAPGVIVTEGAKDAAAPAGNSVEGETRNVTGFVNALSTGDTVNEKFAVCPALTETSGVLGTTK